ncbi:hypothetical protein BGC31_12885 [Komagataeibacter xylinus]|nr:hypothetical protein BFX83_13610 [Komagataeibacter xylinus]RFP03530.1 hypothetical protein BGC31_12885 [Komagataeibacter xylinus]
MDIICAPYGTPRQRAASVRNLFRSVPRYRLARHRAGGAAVLRDGCVHIATRGTAWMGIGEATAVE